MAKLIAVNTALRRIGKAKPLPACTVTLKQALGHVLCENVRAQATLPPLDASAMDGYAVKLAAAHKQGSVFKLIGEAPAGRPFEGKVGKDETVRIFTGGAVPQGANHVIMQENVRADGNKITLTEPISPAKHIRKAGIDFKRGDVILKKGTALGAYELALLAAANCAVLPVTYAPKIALIANGDELVVPGRKLSEGQVISSNPTGLGPLIESWGGTVTNMGISRDEPSEIRAQILAAKAKGADILLPIGGASVGDHDYMRPVFSQMGYKKIFEKVAVKPGKPVWFGTVGEEYVLGLPGNPASALVCAHIFLKPLIYAITGNKNPPHKLVTARTTTALKANTWRTEYIRAEANVDDNGTLHVTPFPRQDSSLITPFLTANCFLVRKKDTPAIRSGGKVQILPIKPFS